MKTTIFHGDSDKELQTFPEVERFVLSLEQISNDLKPALKVKPMNGLGKGVKELILNGRPAYRCVYVVIDDVVHVLHAFSKTSDGTDSKHEKTIKKRYTAAKKYKG